MCATCGCGGPGKSGLEHDGHRRYHPDGHTHADNPADAPVRLISIEQDILTRNNEVAAANRAWLAAAGVHAVNLVSSPGSGKTTLLVTTIDLLAGSRPVAVIEGDQQTSRDAARIRATGAPAVQVNTGKGCHLDARMVAEALPHLPAPAAGSLLFIENVGNLVCPAAFDLGERHTVVVFSVTEGEDKPVKYPDLFRTAALVLLNKCDLLPHLDVDPDLAEWYVRQVNPQVAIIRTAPTTGLGMSQWLTWLRHSTLEHTDRPAPHAVTPGSQTFGAQRGTQP